MTSAWGWRRVRERDRRNWLSRALGPLGAAVPWITVGLLVLMLHFVAGTLTADEGILFDLPEAGLSEGEKTDLVALALAMPRGTLVFFDDARYALGAGVSAAALGERLRERARESGESTLLVLADRNVGTGELMNLATIARINGVKRILFAGKRTGGSAE